MGKFIITFDLKREKPYKYEIGTWFATINVVLSVHLGSNGQLDPRDNGARGQSLQIRRGVQAREKEASLNHYLSVCTLLLVFPLI